MTRKALTALVPLLGLLWACSDAASPPAFQTFLLAGTALDHEGFPQAGWDVDGVVYAPPCAPTTERSDNTARTTTGADGAFTLEISLPRGVESCVNVRVGTTFDVAQQGGSPVLESTSYLHSVWTCAPASGCERASTTVVIPRPGT
ncbi:MAG: hypothetical protein AMXMBFR53_07650 [Gemmatimonadota bacterium]